MRARGRRLGTAIAVATLAGSLELGLSAISPGQNPPASQAPSFRAGIELVSLNVTVSDAATRYVTDLTQDEFQVFEDGVKQDVT